MIHKALSEKTRFKIEEEQKDKTIEQYKKKIADLNVKLQNQQ